MFEDIERIDEFCAETSVEDLRRELDTYRMRDRVSDAFGRVTHNSWVRRFVVGAALTTLPAGGLYMLATADSDAERNETPVSTSTTLTRDEQRCINKEMTIFQADPDMTQAELLVRVEACTSDLTHQ